MKKSKTEIVKSFIAAYNSFDIHSMLTCLHPEVKFKNISGGKMDTETNGVKEFESLARSSSKFFKKREQKIKSIIEADEKVTVKILYHAILAVDLPDGLRAGDEINLNGKSEYIFKNGLIYSIVDES